MWEAVRCWDLEGFVTVSATRWGRGWGRGWGWGKYDWRHVNVVAQNGRETRLFSLTAFGEEVVFWDGNLERPRGNIWRRKVEKCKSRFPSEIQRRARDTAAKSQQQLQTDREFVKRSRECLVQKAHRERDSSRRTLLTSEGRKERLLSRQTLKRKPLGKRKALEFRARTSLCKMCSGKQLQ